MSYCVNCGVELDKTCGSCPLCNTPVYNPNQPVDTESVKPFPVQKGTTELAKRHEIEMPEEQLLLEANKWELSHGGLSGRTAQQFIDYLLGQMK